MNTELLKNIRIVLVHTSHPGNIGAVARAMKTMCLEQLVLVQPKLFPSAEATARASGADDLLAGARVVKNLDEALQDCQLVMGASARLRRLSWPQLDPRQCARQVIHGATHAKVALVFGREHSGLTNEELERCHYLVHIPSNEAYSSLNLAAAVQVQAYELMMALREENAPERGDAFSGPRAEGPFEEGLASAEQLEGFYVHLESMLKEIGFLNPEHPRKMMRRLKRLYHRARLTEVEVNILRGILTGVQHYGQRLSKPLNFDTDDNK